MAVAVCLAGTATAAPDSRPIDDLAAANHVFEIRGVFPDSDMLVHPHAIGAALPKVLADKPVAPMRGHGDIVVGNSIPQMVFRAYYAEMNARLKAEAMRLGPVTHPGAEEAAVAARTNDGVLARTWELWKRQAQRT